MMKQNTNSEMQRSITETSFLALHEKASLLFFLPSFSGLIHRDHFPHEEQIINIDKALLLADGGTEDNVPDSLTA